MSEEPTASSWVPKPPDSESESGEQPTGEVAAAPVTPPPEGLTDEAPAAAVDEPAPVALPDESAPVSEPETAPAAEPVAEAEPEPAAEPEPEPAPEPATEVQPAAEVEPAPVPEPAAAPPVSWQVPEVNSSPAPASSGSGRPELVLAAGFVGGLLLAQVVKRLAK